jgi:y4mF family transcriptional regulator
MKNYKQKPTEGKLSSSDEKAVIKAKDLFPSKHHNEANSGLNKVVQQQPKVLAPRNPVADLAEALKPLNKVQEQLKVSGLKNAIADLAAALKPHNDLQEQLKALSLKNPFADLATAMKPHNDLQRQLKALESVKHATLRISEVNYGEQAHTISKPQELGKLIRKRREARGINQQQLADLSGVGRRFLSELENGKQSLEFGKVLNVASAIGIDLIAKPR